MRHPHAWFAGCKDIMICLDLLYSVVVNKLTNNSNLDERSTATRVGPYSTN